MSVYWFTLFLILLFIELVTVNLVSIWFVIGAVFAILSTTFTDNIFIQFLVFIVVSVISLLVTKPLVKRFKLSRLEPTNLDRVVGKIGEVTKKIPEFGYGEVKVLGAVWTADSSEEIEVGTKIKVQKIDGVKLIVKEEN